MSQVTVRFLIADDHAIVRMGLRAFIAQQENWSVCAEAENGIEAVSRALEFQPHIAIIDLTMPMLSGIEAAQRIREVSPATKILFLTMHDTSVMAHMMRASVADAYVTKGADRDALLKAIAGLLPNGKTKTGGTVEQSQSSTYQSTSPTDTSH